MTTLKHEGFGQGIRAYGVKRNGSTGILVCLILYEFMQHFKIGTKRLSDHMKHIISELIK